MKHSVMLTIVSLLSILLSTFHLADDIARGMSPGGLLNLFVVSAPEWNFIHLHTKHCASHED
jgi:uncharacterized membrane protein YGL010W